MANQDAMLDGLMEMAVDTLRKIGVTLDPESFRRWNRALTRVESEVRKQALEVPRKHAVDYMNLVIGNIMQGKHMAGYAPYHPRYKAWKEQYGHAGGGYWRLFGDLVQAIGTYRVGATGSWQYAWLSGVPAGVDDSGGKSWFGFGTKGPAKEIAWYGGIMEGTIPTSEQEHPARPMFEPTLNEYKGSGEPVAKADSGLIKVAERWR